MALSLLSTSTNSRNGNNVTTLSYNFTVPTGSTILIVGVCVIAGGNGSTVTYNGSSLTFLGRATNSDTVELWYLLNPTTNSLSTCSITIASSAWDILSGWCSWSGNDTTTPFGSVYTNTGTSSTPSVTDTGYASGNASIGFVTQQNVTSSNNTQLWNYSNDGESCAASYSTSTGSLSWNTSGSRFWAAVTASLKPSGSAALIPTSYIKNQAVKRASTY